MFFLWRLFTAEAEETYDIIEQSRNDVRRENVQKI